MTKSSPDTVPRLSIVIPVHNEADCLEVEVETLIRMLDEKHFDYELILSENGSTDGTGRLADALAQKHDRILTTHLSEPDYGAAMKAGFEAARGQGVANFDIDFYDVGFLSRGSRLLDEFGVVVGSKLSGESEDRRSALRRMVSMVFTTLLRILFDPNVDDTHGMKIVRRDVVDRFVPRTVMTKDLFDTELVLRARRAGIPVRAIPVVVEEKRKPRLSIIRRIPRATWGVVRLRWLFWKERFGIAG